jgi:PI-3-kinase-related kinase SMG-1
MDELRTACGRHASQPLSLEECSPVLFKSRPSVLPIPGLAGQSAGLVTIQSFLSKIYVLPTKTRPKKLTLLGSDGRPYTYLFKGMEDLHLDERIMQFLDVINTILSRKGDASIRTRNYHVVPLGDRSGLIQWVDGATPIYTLYKRWQGREWETAKMMAAASENKPVDAAQRSAPLRPGDLFYSKLTPMLKSRSINVANRSKWPAEVLEEVLADLTKATPADLITRYPLYFRH